VSTHIRLSFRLKRRNFFEAECRRLSKVSVKIHVIFFFYAECIRILGKVSVSSDIIFLGGVLPLIR
jgi:hypothetical protein